MADQAPVLQRLGDIDLTVVDPDADVRGRAVLDRDGNEIGEVDDLIVDADEQKVRFLEVGAGGFLGIGEEKFLMPVDAVAEVREDAVRVDQTGDKVRGAPRYDPDLGRPPEDWEGLYGYYGYAPYWTPGYTYPAYPYYPYPPV